MTALPPRKNIPNAFKFECYRSNNQLPLQTLIQMGFPRSRAEKALAATGYRGGPQLAVQWLLSHVNDPTLDDDLPREYILYLCPDGPLLHEIQKFRHKSLEKCGWNEAHNFLPHITLCSFFQAPDICEVLLANALQHCFDKMSKNFSTNIQLNAHFEQDFLGLFVDEVENDVFRRFALMFMKECSDFVHNDNGPLQVIGTCFPWCSSYHLNNPKRVEVRPHLKNLHITLWIQDLEKNMQTLESLLEEINLSSPCFWQFRLYSREQREKNKYVFRVVERYIPQYSDELELTIGDFIYISQNAINNSTDGWVEGISWSSGLSGMLPINFVERTPQTDCWTLHKCIHLGRGNLNHETFNIEPKEISSSHSNESINDESSLPRKLFIIRHAERIDKICEDWIERCFDSENNYTPKDLNMPQSIPKRSPELYPNDCPITNVGVLQATLVGASLKKFGVAFDHVYSSPSLRCVETCTAILKSLESKVKINIEPGLFEWLKWHDYIPNWMSPKEFVENGYNINLDYSPIIKAEDLSEGCKKETLINTYERSSHVIKTILDLTSGSILIVAHINSIETCTRKLLHKPFKDKKSFYESINRVPYLAVALIQQNPKTLEWYISDPLVPSLTHLSNYCFAWKDLLL